MRLVRAVPARSTKTVTAWRNSQNVNYKGSLEKLPL